MISPVLRFRGLYAAKFLIDYYVFNVFIIRFA